jgi:hypothetical protein
VFLKILNISSGVLMVFYTDLFQIVVSMNILLVFVKDYHTRDLYKWLIKTELENAFFWQYSTI